MPPPGPDALENAEDYAQLVDAYGQASRELKEQRDEAANQQALSAAVLATSHDAFISIDAEGRITAWNARAEEMFGWPSAIALGRSLARTIIPPSLRAAHNNGIKRFLANGDGRVFNRRLELTALHRDGTEFPVDMTITPLRLGGTYSFNAFISDATAARRAARHREAQHGVVLSLAEAATIECALAGALKALGAGLQWDVATFWSADRDGATLRCQGIWHGDAPGLQEFAEATRTLVLGPGDGVPGRAWAQGAAIWIENVQRERDLPRRSAAARADLLTVVCVPVRCEGQLVGALELFTTHSRRRERDLLAMLDATASQLGQFVERKRAEDESDRLKNEFFALVSHELRTPLTSIIGYVELLREEPDLAPDLRHFVDVIDRNAGRLQQLLGDVLFVTQVEAGRFDLMVAPVAFNELIKAAVDHALPQAQRGEVTVRTAMAPVPPLLADRDRLHQLLDHLVSNALKFTPSGGEVDVILERDGENGVLLSVRDTGIGIAEDEQERLFERFFRTSEATALAVAGAGLGLTVCKAIVEAHGGRIDVASRPNAGTTVRVHLPAHPVASSDPAAEQPVAS
ncbi:MAG TPA: ATP-binding protein [Solirubrobacteraceae bacterium]|nr:ATP-binding protein [Solirubrobacteraceae bacterium]